MPPYPLQVVGWNWVIFQVPSKPSHSIPGKTDLSLSLQCINFSFKTNIKVNPLGICIVSSCSQNLTKRHCHLWVNMSWILQSEEISGLLYNFVNTKWKFLLVLFLNLLYSSAQSSMSIYIMPLSSMLAIYLVIRDAIFNLSINFLLALSSSHSQLCPSGYLNFMHDPRYVEYLCTCPSACKSS